MTQRQHVNSRSAPTASVIRSLVGRFEELDCSSKLNVPKPPSLSRFLICYFPTPVDQCFIYTINIIIGKINREHFAIVYLYCPPIGPRKNKRAKGLGTIYLMKLLVFSYMLYPIRSLCSSTVWPQNQQRAQTVVLLEYWTVEARK